MICLSSDNELQFEFGSDVKIFKYYFSICTHYGCVSLMVLLNYLCVVQAYMNHKQCSLLYFTQFKLLHQVQITKCKKWN